MAISVNEVITLDDISVEIYGGSNALVNVVDYGGNNDVHTVSLWDVLEWIYSKGDTDESK